MPVRLRTLIAGGEQSDAELIVRALREGGFDPEWRRVMSGEDYVKWLGPELDVILANFRLPQLGALSAIDLLRRSGLAIPLIVVAGAVSEDLAVDWIRQGAIDYLLKDRLARLPAAVMRCARAHHAPGAQAAAGGGVARTGATFPRADRA